MSTQHVIPARDLVEHDLDEACVCHPTSEPVLDEKTERVAGFLVTHHSLDGRELVERSRRHRFARWLGFGRGRWLVVPEHDHDWSC